MTDCYEDAASELARDYSEGYITSQELAESAKDIAREFNVSAKAVQRSLDICFGVRAECAGEQRAEARQMGLTSS